MQSLDSYRIVISKRALKELKALQHNLRMSHVEKIFLLRTAIQTLDIKKLHSSTPLYRIKVGDYRIVFAIFPSEKIIKVLTDMHRREIYKHLNFEVAIDPNFELTEELIQSRKH